jgi:2-polyprenyl-3-methyl-5-hydroxy-6-metoxy-1,4-benzoquinol methylase
MTAWIENLRVMEKTRNYNRWIYDRLWPYLGKRVLEAGCGIGTMTEYLTDRELLLAIDNSEECIRYMKSKYGGENPIILKRDLSNESIINLRKYRIDTVVCINILEHIEDDLRALRYIHALLEDGGILALMVPAFNILFGTIDKSDLHYRRYDRRSLDQKLAMAGFDIIKSHYFDLAGIIPWVLHGKILRKSIHPEMGFLDKFVPIFAFIEKFLTPPVGLSLVYICRKK